MKFNMNTAMIFTMAIGLAVILLLAWAVWILYKRNQRKKEWRRCALIPPPELPPMHDNHGELLIPVEDRSLTEPKVPSQPDAFPTLPPIDAHVGDDGMGVGAHDPYEHQAL
jgi:hypothetical protein